ncbi:MAG: glycosyltransferase family 87 protein [Chloroflexota bacterium]
MSDPTANLQQTVPPAKSQSSIFNLRFLLVIVVINIVLIGGLAAFNASTLVPARGLRFDFYPHWVGGRAVWSGQTPYTHEITRQIQMGMFGEELPPDADQQNLAYPAYTSIIMGPVIAFPAPTAIALWMAIGLASVIWTPIVWMAILNWRPAPLVLFALLLGLTFGFHYPIDMLVLAQFSGTVLLATSLGVWLLTLKRDIAAGIIFVLATVPPTVGGTLALGILAAFALRGRWRGLAAFIVTLGLIVLVSILRIGWWIPDWLRVVREYAAYAPPAWPPNFLPLPLRVLFVAAIIGFALWTLFRFLRPSNTLPVASAPQSSVLISRPSIDLVIAAILTALLLIPQTGYYYLVLLIPVIVACLERARGLPRPERRWVWLSCILAIASPWLYFSLPNFNPDTQSLILPLHVGLTWMAINWRLDVREKS